MNKNILSVVIKKLKFFLTHIRLESNDLLLVNIFKPWKMHIVKSKKNQIKYKWLWLSNQNQFFE